MPFTQSEFFTLVGACNAAHWPFALLLWLATATVLALIQG